MDKIKMLNTPDEEFCRYLWLNKPDPITSRLLNMVEELATWKALKKVIGDDPDEVLDRIRQQEHEVEMMEETVNELHHRIEQLEARTIIDMMNDLEEQLQAETSKARAMARVAEDARRDTERARASEQEMKSKLDMWAIMNR